MSNQQSRLFRIELGVAVVTGVLFVLTVVWRDWIEIVVRIDPDGGAGTVEWAIVAALGVACVVCSVLARMQWRRRLGGTHAVARTR